ncbi:MAG: S-layer homology domain-containing protein [Clostridiales bacterium]
MKTLKRKIPLIVATLIFLFAFCSTGALASEDTYTYRTTENSAIISQYFSEKEEVIIPNTIDSLPVTTIDRGAFNKCKNLIKVTLPNTVKNLPNGLFSKNTIIYSHKSAYLEDYAKANNLIFKVKSPVILSVDLSGFPDVPTNEWYTSYVNDLIQQGLVKGYENGLFLPQNNITRGEFVKILAEASKEDLTLFKGQSVFTDVPKNSWYAPYIMWAYSLGIVTGNGDQTFSPENNISRQEMMVIQQRYATYISKITLPAMVSQMVFSDDAQIATWARDAVKSLQIAGIVNGSDNNKLAPTAFSTRAEATKVVSSFLALLKADNSTKEIKGFTYIPNEKTYWQDGKLMESAIVPTLNNGKLVIPFTGYCQYKNAALVKEEGGKITVNLSNGSWITMQNGSANIQNSQNQSITLSAPVTIAGDEVIVDITSIAPLFGDVVQISTDGSGVFVYPQNRNIDEKNWLQGYRSLQAIAAAKVDFYTSTYGKSGKNQDLSYSVITPSNYTKTIMLVFEQHGFEDDYDKDGQVLVNSANTITEWFKNADIASFNGARLVIVASANPDGLSYGHTNNGPGRCTVVGGVDMNRDWPTSTYQSSTTPRNYTLSPLSCNETKSLKDLITTMSPNVLLDCHGWLNGTYGDKRIADIFKKEMGLPYKTLFSTSSSLSATNVTYLSDAEIEDAYLSGLVGFKGYLAGYGFEQNITSALVEFTAPNALDNNKLANAIKSIAKTF